MEMKRKNSGTKKPKSQSGSGGGFYQANFGKFTSHISNEEEPEIEEDIK